ncbi:MAG: dihydrofolate reductase [Treponema sp.]|uniref:dihydrofolate reductase n=1 Tax=Treponema sp. TaxID=166 RepID=UPI00298E34A5|nr:dihydrofolate reductase [Treponema sp.]MCQ2601849.1 dihydrofolate reductase [Treponema sp.]
MQKVFLIAAYAHNRVIGFNGAIPWNIPGEQSRFRKLTTGNVVIMGRKTFDEIFQKLKKPLPGRINIIISKTKSYSDADCYTFSTLKDAVDFSIKEFPEKDIFISGGESLYKEGISLAEKLFLTEIDMDVKGDVFFPDFNENDYVKNIEEEFTEPVSYRYVTYTKLS